MSRRPTRAYRLYTDHGLEELTALMVEVQSHGLPCGDGQLILLHPADIKLSHELARAIQWKLDERNPHG
jgi:hypothetical protein